MSGLDVESFNLFGKKPNKASASRPVAIPVTSPKVIEEEIKKFDDEAEFEIELLPEESLDSYFQDVVQEMVSNGEIERFVVEPAQMKPVLTKESFEKPLYTPAKSIEVNLKPIDKNKDDAVLRKFETFVAPTFRIPEQHDLELKKIEHFIMRNRKKGNNSDSRERITTNTVVRAMIANFLERAGDMDLSNIDNEEMLKDRMEKVFKQKYVKRV
jgi:hypothetical protein